MAEKNIDVILAGAADHRQYPNNTIETFDDPEYLRYRQMALQEGFAYNNPTTFFIQHVYATLVGTFFNREDV